MKKYIHIAKCMRPVMTDEASSLIAEEYADLRTADFAQDMARTQPVTARALETLIRLSTAHAKVSRERSMHLSLSFQIIRAAVGCIYLTFFNVVNCY